MGNSANDAARLVPSSDRSLLRGVVFGVIVGAIGAALAAPSRGSATRELIRERSLELKDRADTVLRGRTSPL